MTSGDVILVCLSLARVPTPAGGTFGLKTIDWTEEPLRKKKRIKYGHDKVCDYSDQRQEECHNDIFGCYCVATVVRLFKSDPANCTKEVATEEFTTRYNNALDFYNFCVQHEILPRACYIPPGCMREKSLDYVLCWLKHMKKSYFKEARNEVAYKSDSDSDEEKNG